MKITTLLLLVVTSFNLLSQEAEISPYSIGEKHIIHSKVLNEDREVLIHVPQGFWGLDEKPESYPVLFVLDGDSQFMNTVSAIDYISSAPMGNDIIPRTIVVGIPNPNRNYDFTPYKGIMGSDSTQFELTGGGPFFLEFITSEVSTYIDSLYPTNTHRSIIGHSLGGLIVFQALLTERGFFTNYLALDPALDFDNESYFNQILDTLRTADLSQEKLFIAKAYTLPTFLDPSQIKGDTSEFLQLEQSNLKFLEFAENENWNIQFAAKSYPDETHFSVPYIGTYEGLKYFYSCYKFNEIIDYFHPSFKNRIDLIDRLKKHYDNISDEVGYEVKPMQSYIQSWAYGLTHFGRSDLAIDMFDYNIKIRPKIPSALNLKANYLINHDQEKEAIPLLAKSLSLQNNGEILKTLIDLKSRQ